MAVKESGGNRSSWGDHEETPKDETQPVFSSLKACAAVSFIVHRYPGTHGTGAGGDSRYGRFGKYAIYSCPILCALDMVITKKKLNVSYYAV